MRMYEFEGSDLFRREGIPVPDCAVATSPQEARQKAEAIGLPVVIKAQVLVGGRGLAGGVQTAESPDQVEEVAQRILNCSIKGLPVHRVMVARKIAVTQEFYVGVTVDGYKGTPVAILSSAGGVSIEEVARAYPEQVVSRPVPIATGLVLSEAQQMARKVGLDGEDLAQVASILHTLYGIFRKYDALITEINPLVRTPQGTYLALDAKVEIDDSSLYRHPNFQVALEDSIPNPLERRGHQIGVTYVELDGEIGIIASGAGLGMATMDIISRRFRPANFLETGGAITEDLLYQTMDLVLQKKGLKAIFINVYGGINPIHEGAKGVVRYIREHGITIPVVAKALGNRQEETWEILREGGVSVVTEVATEKGIERLARLMEGGA
ncbi:MAG: Succinate--CoA ligase (GDP-forming) subunit beta [Chloroflexi bacterium]|nr:Succinate--CoA ligase (GDP-forming) subunit beta [Chloroflexota bacterium]